MGPLFAVRPAIALAVAAGTLAAVAGCGSPPGTRITSTTLTVFTSLPLSGERGPEGRAVLRGEKLALRDAGARVGEFTIALQALDDVDPKEGAWTPEQAAANAKQAASNPTTIAYIGDLDSGATAVSLPINNEVGVLQVSPLSGYTGLTNVADKGEPQKYYPSGKRTFARLAPDGAQEARWLAGWLARLGYRDIAVAHDGLEDGQGALIDLEEAFEARRLRLLKAYRVDPRPKHKLAGDVHHLVGLHADAVVYAGGDSDAAARLLRALHAADPSLALFVTSAATHGALASALGSAATAVRGISPLVGLPQDRASRRLERAYRASFGADAPPAARYGFEAMRTVLEAIGAAGDEAQDRASVIAAYLRGARTGTVLGDYRMNRRGDVVGLRSGAFRIADDRLVLVERLGDGAA